MADLLDEELALLKLRFYGHPEYFARRQAEGDARREADVMYSIRRCARVRLEPGPHTPLDREDD